MKLVPCTRVRARRAAAAVRPASGRKGREADARPSLRRVRRGLQRDRGAEGLGRCRWAVGGKKSPEAIARIMGAVKSNIIFSRLNETQLQMLQGAMNEAHVAAGSNVITQGEKGNHFYVVDSGDLDAFVTSSDAGAEPRYVKSFGVGDSFGELALMYNCPRTATIQARTDVVLWSLDRVSFRMIVLEANTKKASMYETFLEKVQLLEPLVEGPAQQDGRRVRGGLVRADGGPRPSSTRVSRGGHALLHHRRGRGLHHEGRAEGAPWRAARPATISARRRSGRARRRSRPSRRRPPPSSCGWTAAPSSGCSARSTSCSRCESTRRAASSSSADDGDAADGRPPPSRRRRGPCEHVFEKAERRADARRLHGDEGDAGRGRVRQGAPLRRCTRRGQVFALKQMCKSDIVQMGQVEHIMQETQILSTITHPFVTNKFGGFVTKANLILIMEFCPGGDLFDQLYRHKSFSLKDVRIFSSQILLPLEYLHALGIVHRDLKLENVLVAQDGALKLTDFGFAKKIKYRSWTLCGTPEYLAPEIILEKGHGKAVDWWAFGVLFYEMLNGHSPFEAEDHLATYQKILDGTVNYPSKMPALAVDLVGKLLQKDITRRYGNLKDGAGDIKNHAVYKEAGHEFSWDQLRPARASALKPPSSTRASTSGSPPTPSSPRRSRANPRTTSCLQF